MIGEGQRIGNMHNKVSEEQGHNNPNPITIIVHIIVPMSGVF